MRKVLTLFGKVFMFFTFLLVSTLSFSQESSELNQLTTGKWHIYSMEIGEEKTEYAKEYSSLELESDGKYRVVMNEEEKIGTWKLNPEKNELEFDNGAFEKNFQIKKLDENELLVYASEGEVDYTVVFRR